jgi:hypothetical protein
MVSKQLPVTFPSQPPRQVPSAARHAAAPLSACVTHWPRHAGMPGGPAVKHPWTQLLTVEPTLAKHVSAVLPHPVAHEPG